MASQEGQTVPLMEKTVDIRFAVPIIKMCLFSDDILKVKNR